MVASVGGEEAQLAFSYCFDCTRGLLHSLHRVQEGEEGEEVEEGPERQLPELAEGGLQLRSTADLERWGRYRREAWALWRSYVAQQWPQLLRSPPPALPQHSRRVVVVVEPRPHCDLEFVLRRTFAELEAGAWALLVICGLRNEAFARRACASLANARLWRLGVEDLDAPAYAAFRRSEALLRLIEAQGGEVALFLECDAVLLRRGCERFLHYDLVGAPWSWALRRRGHRRSGSGRGGRGQEEGQGAVPETREDEGEQEYCVGNGGLCLRRVDFMRRALRHMGATSAGEVPPPYASRNEDICFARAAWEMGARVPDVAEAAAFSVETLFHPTPVGCHKPWQYLLPSQLRRVLGLGKIGPGRQQEELWECRWECVD